jgi:prepilin-type N-terminal cleavage/methylation domain-containing protein
LTNPTLNRQALNAVKQQGFTLLELLVVVSILAALAFTTATSLQGVDQTVDAQLERTELAEVAKAVRQFRADTGYFPKEGPFDIQSSTLPAGCQDDYEDLTATVHPAAALSYEDFNGSGNCDNNLLWFYHAANLSQLTGVANVAGTMGARMEAVMPWNALAGRGWRGPYLDASAEGYVDMGNVNTVVDSAVAQGPETTAVIENIPAIFAGGEKKPNGNYYQSRRVFNGSNLDWAGRPILMFLEKYGDAVVEKAVLLSAGNNGVYDGYNPVDCSPVADDEVICIYAD